MEGLLAGLGIALAFYAAIVLLLLVAGRRLAARELMLLPANVALLFRDLMRDPLVPRRTKVLLAIGVCYLAMPIDIIPDFVPIAGQLDDVIVATLVLRQVLRSSGPETVRRHWRGDARTIDRLLWAAAK